MQSFNFEAIKYFFKARFKDPSLLVPHMRVKDISCTNPEDFEKLGFRGIVFDKDNTLTEPLENEIYPSIRKAFINYKSVFGDKLVIFSDSAGTKDDKDYESAKKIEDSLGIKVIKHDRKKPGGIEDVLDYFDCYVEDLVCIGDRILTDVVFGNLNGMLTVYTQPLVNKESAKIANYVRIYEKKLLAEMEFKGVRSPKHDGYDPYFFIDNLVPKQ